jgi:hypothetical protein
METSRAAPCHEYSPPTGVAPRSLTNQRLKGRSLVKLVYLDEAGKANPAHEPYFVVAAVIVDGDKDTGTLTKELDGIAREYKVRGITNFHANDIWRGSGTYSRDDPKWPLSRRLDLFASLASLPKKLNLPVAIGHVYRPTFKIAFYEQMKGYERTIGRPLKPKKADLYAAEHQAAFVKAAKCVDTWMQKNARTQRAMLIAESVPDIKRSLKLLHHVSQTRDIDVEMVGVEPFKTEHIIDTLHFAEKHESPFLQMADFCAFIAKRKLMKRLDIEAHYKLIEPQIIRLNRVKEPFNFSSSDRYWEDEEE